MPHMKYASGWKKIENWWFVILWLCVFETSELFLAKFSEIDVHENVVDWCEWLIVCQPSKCQIKCHFRAKYTENKYKQHYLFIA